MKSLFCTTTIIVLLAVSTTISNAEFATTKFLHNRKVCREAAIDSESCQYLNGCHEKCQNFWDTWDEPLIPEGCGEELNQYCTERWSCCPECIHKITEDVHCALQRELGFICNELDCGGTKTSFNKALSALSLERTESMAATTTMTSGGVGRKRNNMNKSLTTFILKMIIGIGYLFLF